MLRFAVDSRIFYNRVNGNSVYMGCGPAIPPIHSQRMSMSATIQQPAATGTRRWLHRARQRELVQRRLQWDSERNASFGIQRNIGWNTVLDASWVADWGVNQPWTYNINPIPLGADFAAQNADPTQKAGSVLPTIFERTIYPGWGNLTQQAWGGSTNYNSLQTAIRKRLDHGVEISANFTWSRAMGLTSFQPLVANNAEYNYGPGPQTGPELLLRPPGSRNQAN